MATQRGDFDHGANASEKCSSKSQQVQVEHHVEKPSQAAEMVVISSDDEVEIIGVNNRTNGTEYEGGNIDKPSTGCSSPSTKDSTCSVCLSEYDNKAFLDRCFHAFCYFCILQWSEIVHTCPLCKSAFSSIIHSVKSMDNYQQHFLSKPGISLPTCHQQSQGTGGRFRYRTTLVEGRRSQQQATRRRQQEETTDAWGQRERQRHTYMSSQRNRTLMARERRRTIYSSNLWVRQIIQEGRPRQRDISPAFFRANPACSHRLIPWLTRELRVLLNDEESHVNFVLQILLTLITKIEITSDEFCKQLQPFLFGKTEHFIHEFKSFAQSPFDVTAYDARAQYDWPSQSRQSTRDTPTVFHSETAGWQTPDVVPGPSGISMQELSRTDWTDDLQARENSSWSPRSSPGTPRLNASRIPELVEFTALSGHSETAPRNAHSLTRVDISTSSSRTRIYNENVSMGERIDDLSAQASSNHHHRHCRKHKHKHKHKGKRKKHLNEDSVLFESHPVERSSELAGPSRISLESLSSGPSIDIITVSSDGVFTPDAEEDIRQNFAPSSAAGKASYSGSSKSRQHRGKRRSLSGSRSQSRSRKERHSRHETRSRARSRCKNPKHVRGESRSRSRSYSDSPSETRSRSRCRNLKHERDENRSRPRSRSYSDSPSETRSRSRCKNLKHERDENRSRPRYRSDWDSPSETRSRSRCKNLKHERDEDRSRTRSRCSRDSRTRTSSESRSRARNDHIERRCSEERYRSRSYLHSQSRARAPKENGSGSLSLKTTASIWHEEKQVRAPSRCSSEKKGSEALLCRSSHAKSHSRNRHSRCQSRSRRSHANSRSRERSASRSSARRSVSETNETVLPSNEDIEEEIKDLEFRIATDKKRLLQLLIKQEKTAGVSDSGKDEGDQNAA